MDQGRTATSNAFEVGPHGRICELRSHIVGDKQGIW